MVQVESKTTGEVYNASFGGTNKKVDTPLEQNRAAYRVWKNLSQTEQFNAVKQMGYSAILKLASQVQEGYQVLNEFPKDSRYMPSPYEDYENLASTIHSEKKSIIMALDSRYSLNIGEDINRAQFVLVDNGINIFWGHQDHGSGTTTSCFINYNGEKLPTETIKPGSAPLKTHRG